jgi:UDP-GlcNAc:undecaprenyl-phosphate GlcNAc-1-phosphate transferase
MDPLLLFSQSFITSFFVSLIGTYFVIKIAWKIKLIDDPRKNKHPKVTHTKPTPRGGGLAIFLSVIVSVLLFLPFDQHVKGILLGAIILVVMGLLDDKYNINPYIRLCLQFLAAAAPVAAGIGIAFWKPPFGEMLDLSQPQIHFFLLGQERSIWILSDLFAVFWIVMLINFINMGAKGLPGQLSGVVGIAALTIAGLSFRFSADITEWPVIILAAITAGAFLGFLPWHMWPQKIMPSFSGSNLGGYLLAVLSILTTAKVGTLALVLGVPLVDTGYTILRRVASGKSPVWGDRGHLHHKLLDIGWSQSKVTYFYWIITGLLGISALYLNAQNKLYTMVGVTFLIGGIILWLTHRRKRSKQS